jgi:hypothetical protein
VPWYVWLLCLLGAGLLLAALWLLAVPWLVGWFGSVVHATVTGKSASEPPQPPSYHVRFTYHFKGQEHSAEAAVDQATLDRLYVGLDVKVKVLGLWPDRPRLWDPRGRVSWDANCLLAGALLWVAAAAVLLWRSLRKALRQRDLVRDGVATAGWVVRKEAGGGRRATGHIHYAYRAPQFGVGRQVGTSGDGAAAAEREWQVVMAVGHRDFEAAQAGEAVLVLYDPHQPSHSVIYPFADYEAVTAPAPEETSAG